MIRLGFDEKNLLIVVIMGLKLKRRVFLPVDIKLTFSRYSGSNAGWFSDFLCLRVAGLRPALPLGSFFGGAEEG